MSTGCWCLRQRGNFLPLIGLYLAAGQLSLGHPKVPKFGVVFVLPISQHPNRIVFAETDNTCTLEIKLWDKPRQHIKKKKHTHHFVHKGLYGQSYGFSSSHVRMWELDSKKNLGPNWCFQSVVLEKTLESPLDSKEIKPINPKGDQPWIFIGRTDAKAEAPILWPPDANSWLIGKDLDAGKDWRQEEKEAAEDEMVR